MPIYEYQCGACGHQHEEIQKLSDKPLRKCPECGKLKLKKLVSAAGFRLSGSGWYETDFKSDKKKNLAEKDSKEPVSKKDKSEKKDAKPAKESKKTSSSSSATGTDS